MLYIVLGSITALLCGFDLWCKWWVEENIRKGEKREVCKKKVVLRKVHNKGFAMNVGDKKPEVIRVVSGIVCALVAVFALFTWKDSRSWLKKVGAVFTLAGAISNTYDRLKRKYVVDYFSFKTKSEKFNKIAFNLADMFIFIGAILIVLGELFGKDN